MIKNRINGFFNKIFLQYLKFRYKKLKIGKNVRIDWISNIDIYNNYCKIGDNVIIQSFRKNYHAGIPFPSGILIDITGASVEIGDNTYIHGTYIHAQNSIKIGNNCAIASGVNIIDSNGHKIASKKRNLHRDKPEQIIIGNNVWIGLNCIILKGTIIGDNSIISAGSVVKGIFPENSIISGNPALLVDKIIFED